MDERIATEQSIRQSSGESVKKQAALEEEISRLSAMLQERARECSTLSTANTSSIGENARLQESFTATSEENTKLRSQYAEATSIT